MQVQDSNTGSSSTTPIVPQHEQFESVSKGIGAETPIDTNFTRQQGQQGPQAQHSPLPSPPNLHYSTTPYNEYQTNVQQRFNEYQPVPNYHSNSQYTTNQFHPQQRPPYNTPYGNDNEYYSNEQRNNSAIYGTSHMQQQYQHPQSNITTPDVTVPAPVWIAIGSLAGLTAAAAVRWLNGGDFTLLPPPYISSILPSASSTSSSSVANSTRSISSSSNSGTSNRQNKTVSKEELEEDSDEDDDEDGDDNDDNDNEDDENDEDDEEAVAATTGNITIAKEKSVKVVVDNTLVLKSLLEGMNSSLERQEGLVRRLVSDRERDITNQSMNFLLNHEEEKKKKQYQNEQTEQEKEVDVGERQCNDHVSLQETEGPMDVPISMDMISIKATLKKLVSDLESISSEMEKLSVPPHNDAEVNKAEKDDKINDTTPSELLINSATDGNSEIQVQSDETSQENTESMQSTNTLSTTLQSSMNIVSKWQSKIDDSIQNCAKILDQMEIIITSDKSKSITDCSITTEILPDASQSVPSNNTNKENSNDVKVRATITTSNEIIEESVVGVDNKSAIETTTTATATATNTNDVDELVEEDAVIKETNALQEYMTKDCDEKTKNPTELVVEALQKLVLDNENTKQLHSSIQVLYLYIFNLSIHPKNTKYRKIHTASGSTYQHQIVKTAGASDLLQAVGFLQSSQNSSLLEWDPATVYKNLLLSSSSSSSIPIPDNEIEDIYVDLSKQVATALKLIRSKLVESSNVVILDHTIPTDEKDITKSENITSVSTVMSIFNEVFASVGLRSDGTGDETLSSV
jgi:PUB domain